MADTTPATPPKTGPAPKKSKITRGETNQQILDELANAKKVAASALDATYASGLADVDLDPTLPGQINTLAAKITTDLGGLKNARVAKKTATKQEIATRDALIAVLAPIQTAAKRKFKGTEAAQRAAYYIGSSLGTQTLDEVLLAARNVLARLTPGKNNAQPTDVLPGIKANGAIKDLADAISDYADDNTEQGDQQQEASAALEAIWADVTKLAGLRRDVQLAADQAWPWRDKGTATIRKAFLLPASQPFKD